MIRRRRAFCLSFNGCGTIFERIPSMSFLLCMYKMGHGKYAPKHLGKKIGILIQMFDILLCECVCVWTCVILRHLLIRLTSAAAVVLATMAVSTLINKEVPYRMHDFSGICNSQYIRGGIAWLFFKFYQLTSWTLSQPQKYSNAFNYNQKGDIEKW